MNKLDNIQSFILEHKSKRIIGYSPISINNIKEGQIINFNYESQNNKNPHVLVLNPNFNNLLHGIVIDYISVENLDKLIKIILGKELNKINNNQLPTSLFKNYYNPQSFYDLVIKNFLKSIINHNIYRTYKLNKMNNIKLVNYKLKDK